MANSLRTVEGTGREVKNPRSFPRSATSPFLLSLLTTVLIAAPAYLVSVVLYELAYVETSFVLLLALTAPFTSSLVASYLAREYAKLGGYLGVFSTIIAAVLVRSVAHLTWSLSLSCFVDDLPNSPPFVVLGLVGAEFGSRLRGAVRGN